MHATIIDRMIDEMCSYVCVRGAYRGLRHFLRFPYRRDGISSNSIFLLLLPFLASRFDGVGFRFLDTRSGLLFFFPFAVPAGFYPRGISLHAARSAIRLMPPESDGAYVRLCVPNGSSVERIARVCATTWHGRRALDGANRC